MSRADFGLILCGLLLAALTAFGLTLPQPVPGIYGIGYWGALHRFVILAVPVEGLIYGCAALIILRARPGRWRLWIVLGFAALLRLIVLPAPPFLSSDIFRYIWDGWVQGAGINPYRYIPVDPHLAFLRDAAVYPNINRATYAHTIYPPAAEMIFCMAAMLGKALGLPPVLAMKLFLTGLEGIGIWAMTRLLARAGLPRARVLIYAWNPLPVWEFAGSGHVDAIVICFISLALLAVCHERRLLGMAAFAVAVLAKFLPLLWAPVIWRRWDWRAAAVFIALAVLFYLPYLGVGAGVFGFLGGYGDQEGIASGKGLYPLALLGQILPLPPAASKIYLGAAALLLAGLAVRMLRRPPACDPARAVPQMCRRALLLGAIGMAALSPHYPWYFAWALIPSCVVPTLSVIYLATAAPLLYLNPVHTALFWPAFLYGPFVLLALWDVWGAKFRLAPRYPTLAEGERP